jgi:hypothetical protein
MGSPPEFPCGCKLLISMLGGQMSLDFCPRHSAAPKMYEAFSGLLAACDFADMQGDLSEYISGERLDACRAALALSDGDTGSFLSPAPDPQSPIPSPQPPIPEVLP